MKYQTLGFSNGLHSLMSDLTISRHCHSCEGRNPRLWDAWLPVFAGMTSCRSYWHLVPQGRQLVLMALLCSMLFIAACGSRSEQRSPQASGDQAGRILLWHSWSGDEAVALQTLLDRFHDVYPKIDVVAAPYPANDLAAEFADQATQGLGPDLLIGDQLWTPALADAGFIRSIDEKGIDPTHYLSSAITTLKYESQIYGIPLSVRTSALYYNQSLTEEPPSTLEALLEQAQEGKKVGINSNFVAAFWGIHAFGGELLDEQGKIILNEGGFTNWLDWLLEAQNMPNVLISNDNGWLFEQFSRGEIAYYVGDSSELLAVKEALGEERTGVAPLPAGPNDDAGPLLQTEAIFLSTASSKEQNARALLLAKFLTNEEQQRKLAQLAGRIPANNHVRIDRRISPAVAGFVEQSKTAVPFRLLPQLFDLVEQGDDAYMQALEGLVDAAEAADELTLAVNQSYGFPSDERLTQSASAEVNCSAFDHTELIIWHSWTGADAAAIKEIAERFVNECEGSQLDLVYRPVDELTKGYRALLEGTTPTDKTLSEEPDLLILPHRQIAELGKAGLALNLDAVIEPAFLQRYSAAASAAMRTDKHLFGLPVTINTMVLYSNQKITPDEPRLLADLLSVVSPQQPLAMSYSPSYKTHWGIAGFGGRLFNADGELTVEGDGFAEWLAWLREAQDHPGMMLLPDQEEAQERFISGEAAYLVADGTILPTLLAKLGPENLGVLPLPAGPSGPSAPIVDVQGIVINPQTEKQEPALALARQLTDEEGQAHLMQEAYLIPANMTIQQVAHPAFSAFWEQAKTAIALPNRPEINTVLELGDMIYTGVLEKEKAPEDVLAEFNKFIANLNGVRNGLEEEEDALAVAEEQCTIASTLLINPEKSGSSPTAVEQIAASLIRICPNIKPSNDIFVTNSVQENGTQDSGVQDSEVQENGVQSETISEQEISGLDTQEQEELNHGQ